MADYKKSSVHCHSTMCDGKNTLQDMASAACAQGLTTLGFTGHSYTQRDREYCMSPSRTAQYKATIAKLKAAIEAVKKDPRALARWGGSVPKNLKLPLRDGDTEKDDENYEGCYFLNANASENRRPKIIDRACNDVLDQDEVYSGCYANVKIGLFSYSASGNKGIGAGLEVIQKVRDGERLSGGNSTDGFEVLSDDDDSFLD